MSSPREEQLDPSRPTPAVEEFPPGHLPAPSELELHNLDIVVRHAAGVIERLQAEQSIRESEERFRALISATSDVVYRMSGDWSEMHFLRGRQLIADTSEPSRSWLDKYIHRDDQQRVTEAVQQAIRARSVFELEHRVIQLDGSLGWMLSRAVPILDERGEILEWFGAASDVTTRKQAEEAVRRSEERQRLLLELADTLRPLADPTAVQDAVLRLLGEHLGVDRAGYAEVDADGEHMTVTRDWCRAGTPSVAGSYREGEGSAFTGPMRAGGLLATDDAATDPRIGPERYASWKAIGVRSAVVSPIVKHGRLVAALFVHQATPRRWSEAETSLLGSVAERAWNALALARAERALRVSEQTFATLIERCPFGIYIVDANLKIVQMNQRSQEVAFSTVRPVIDRPLDEVIRVVWPEEVAADILRAFRRTLDTGEPYFSADFVNPRADKERVEGYEWELHRIALPDGRYGVVCYFFDSTRLREAEQMQRRLANELAAADRRKDEFLATLAHELRNPLAPIANVLHLLKIADGNAAVVRDANAIIERQFNQLVRLVDDLLDVSRIGRGKVQFRKDRLLLSEAVEMAIETSGPLVYSHGHELSVRLTAEPVPLMGDKARLAQVFGNLLNNAAKYTPRGGRIRVTAERAGPNVSVRVVDSGVGIPREMLQRVFELFTQVDSSAHRQHGGLGIGLTLVRQLVEQHGGTVEARSEGIGKGAEFVVVLPIDVDAGAAAELADPAGLRPHAVGAARRRVLVIDDNRDAANTLGNLLRVWGHEVDVTYDGTAGLEAAAALRPEVILLDVGMPKLSGYDVARRIRDEQWGHAPMIVALTGWGQDDDKRRAREAGFDHHMTKPVNTEQLQRLIAST